MCKTLNIFQSIVIEFWGPNRCKDFTMVRGTKILFRFQTGCGEFITRGSMYEPLHLKLILSHFVV